MRSARSPPFDLVVIDEAHEIFAGLHKRLRPRRPLRRGLRRSADGAPRPRLPARRAGAAADGDADAELARRACGAWCSTSSRPARCSATSPPSARCSAATTTAPWCPARSTSCSGAWPSVLQRTLRRQAQEFLDRPFTQRRCRLYEYAMSDDERSLYDDVTEYLLRAVAVCLRRRAAAAAADRLSSPHGLVDRGARREPRERRRRGCAGSMRGTVPADDAADVLRDLEEETSGRRSRRQCRRRCRRRSDPDASAVARELARVEGFVARARSLPHDAKARSLSGCDPGHPRSRPRRPRQRQGGGLHRVDHHAGVPAHAAARHRAGGRGHHPVSRQQRLAARASRRTPVGSRKRARNLPPGVAAEPRGGGAAGAGPRVPHALEDPGLHRGRRQGAEPAVLRDGHQLRPAVESAAHRAADRPLPSLQPAARRHGRQLHRQGQRGAPADVRDPEPEARSVRQGARCLGRRAARAAHRRAGDRGVGAVARVRDRSARHLQPVADDSTR